MSLARAQMAVWFFLVIGSYFFLWLLTGDMDTMNTSIVALTGISAGTAVSSALLDSSKDRAADFDEEVPHVNLKQSRLEILNQVRSLLQRTENELQGLMVPLARMLTADDAALVANMKEHERLRERKKTLERYEEFFCQPLWRVIIHDLLSERGVITFHRFQMCVWTLVLGLIFIITVYSEVAMPEFSVTLLGLMGVSAGTFIGFKLPEENRARKGLPPQSP